jgi:hypothetical protein
MLAGQVGVIVVVEKTQSTGENTIPNLCWHFVEQWTVRLDIPVRVDG